MTNPRKDCRRKSINHGEGSDQLPFCPFSFTKEIKDALDPTGKVGESGKRTAERMSPALVLWSTLASGRKLSHCENFEEGSLTFEFNVSTAVSWR
jgi:hypothetical protein